MSSLRVMARLACLAACLALVGCGFARFPHQQNAALSAASGSCERQTGTPGEVRVCPGDTLIGLSRQLDVTVMGLMRENGLASDRIFVGQTLRVPPESVHVVQPGDGLLAIAREYSVPVSSVIAANDLRRPYVIFPEQRLAIPRGGELVAASASAGRPEAASRNRQDLPQSQPVTTAPASGTVVIGSGVPQAETDWNTGDVSSPRGETASSGEQPGQTHGAEPIPTVDPAESPAQAGSEPAGEAPGPIPRARVREPESRTVASAASPTRPAAAAPKSAPAPAKAAFLLPVQGRIVSEFGPKSGGLHNDGINIAAPRGTPIVATADGEIAYAGDGLPGFGNLILIRHEDGWTSAYAHADTMAVKRGDKVKRGDVIGQVGNTGSVTDPQLHFELRKHDRAVDPKPLLGT